MTRVGDSGNSPSAALSCRGYLQGRRSSENQDSGPHSSNHCIVRLRVSRSGIYERVAALRGNGSPSGW
jgi:hypothetical protein